MSRMQRFIVPSRLASYTEMMRTRESAGHLAEGREDKNVKLVRYAIRHFGIKPVKHPPIIRIKWIEPSSNRRHTDVAAASIFIERALEECGIVSRGMLQLGTVENTFRVNAVNPRVEVIIEEV